MDEFDSFIWTERYDKLSEFSFLVPPSKKNQELFYEGVVIAHSDTKRLMVVETVSDTEDQDGTNKLKISGWGVESFLENRSIIPNHVDGTNRQTTNIGWMTSILVRDTCTSSAIRPDDAIPLFTVANDAGTATPITNVSIKGKSTLAAVEELCHAEGLGYKVEHVTGTFRLRYTAYKGVDRPNVHFSSTLDTLAEESHITSYSKFKNVAYVWGKNGKNVEVIPSYFGTSIVGRARRVLFVDASDIEEDTVTPEKYLGLLRRRGLEALSEHKRIRLFDGVLTTNNPYKYGVHYNLGDTVYFIDEYGKRQQVRVTEYIWAWDHEGLRSYPTFEVIESGN